MNQNIRSDTTKIVQFDYAGASFAELSVKLNAKVKEVDQLKREFYTGIIQSRSDMVDKEPLKYCDWVRTNHRDAVANLLLEKIALHPIESELKLQTLLRKTLDELYPESTLCGSIGRMCI